MIFVFQIVVQSSLCRILSNYYQVILSDYMTIVGNDIGMSQRLEVVDLVCELFFNIAVLDDRDFFRGCLNLSKLFRFPSDSVNITAGSSPYLFMIFDVRFLYC